MTTNDKQMFAGWEFKGIQIHPLAIAARNIAINIVSGMNPGPVMFAAVVYAAIAKRSDLMKGLRNPDWFMELVSAWMEEVGLVPADYEELGTIFRELVENADANRAAPASDPNMMPDPVMGNG